MTIYFDFLKIFRHLFFFTKWDVKVPGVCRPKGWRLIILGIRFEGASK